MHFPDSNKRRISSFRCTPTDRWKFLSFSNRTSKWLTYSWILIQLDTFTVGYFYRVGYLFSGCFHTLAYYHTESNVLFIHPWVEFTSIFVTSVVFKFLTFWGLLKSHESMQGRISLLHYLPVSSIIFCYKEDPANVIDVKNINSLDFRISDAFILRLKF